MGLGWAAVLSRAGQAGEPLGLVSDPGSPALAVGGLLAIQLRPRWSRWSRSSARTSRAMDLQHDKASVTWICTLPPDAGQGLEDR